MHNELLVEHAARKNEEIKRDDATDARKGAAVVGASAGAGAGAASDKGVAAAASSSSTTAAGASQSK